MGASQVISPSTAHQFSFNQPLSPESVSGHSSDFDSSSGSDDRSSSHSPISAASHHSQNHHNVAYPTTEKEQQQQGQPVTRSPTNNTLPERPLVPTCPADWEAKKDIIYDLYMNKNFILNDVVEIMLSTHRFKATARMYKGQFAKWRWAKYNKSGNINATKPTKSRSMRRKGVTSSSGSGSSHSSNGHVSKPGGCHHQAANFISQPAQMIRLYFQSEESYLVESTLLAYASYIARWADPERQTPWKTDVPRRRLYIANNDGIDAADSDSATMCSNSILQNIALAIRHLRCNSPQGTAKGGALLRHAFLQIEEAITLADEGDIQAIWDCCLAVPQLLILHNNASSSSTTTKPHPSSSQHYHHHVQSPPDDILPIYTRFLHHLTTLKYASSTSTSHSQSPGSGWTSYPHSTSTSTSHMHPLHQISSSLHHLVTTSDFVSLHFFITRAWKLWINTCRQLRGETDHVTIHLKRGYVILMDPEHAIVKNLVSDFGGLVRREMERWGEAKTTERILELEGLLGRMYLPLFDAGVNFGGGMGGGTAGGGMGGGMGQGGGGGGRNGNGNGRTRAGDRARGMLGGLIERLEDKYRVGGGGSGMIAHGVGSMGSMGTSVQRIGTISACGNTIPITSTSAAARPPHHDLVTQGPAPPPPPPAPAPGHGQGHGQPQGLPLGSPAPPPIPMQNWEYLDRYLFFSAHHFLASIADYEGDVSTAAALRRKILVMNGGGLPPGTGTVLSLSSNNNNQHQLPFGSLSSNNQHQLPFGMGFSGMGIDLGGSMGSLAAMGGAVVGTGMGIMGAGTTTRGRDQFWVQTTRKVEAYLRGVGNWEEAEEFRGALRERERELEVERERVRNMQQQVTVARSESGSGSGSGVLQVGMLTATRGAGLEGHGGRSMSVPSVPCPSTFAVRNSLGGLGGTITPRSYYGPFDDLNLHPGSGASFSRLLPPIPIPIPIPRSVPIQIQQDMDMHDDGNANMEFVHMVHDSPSASTSDVDGFDDFPTHQFHVERAAALDLDLDLSSTPNPNGGAGAGGSSGNSSGAGGGGGSGSNLHHDGNGTGNGNGNRHEEDRWGRWREVMAL